MTGKPAAEPTEYVVLRRYREEVNRENAAPGNLPEQWSRVVAVEARSAEAAIRKAAALPTVSDLDVQVLVAVPSRSWKPVTVTAEVQTKLRLESV